MSVQSIVEEISEVDIFFGPCFMIVTADNGVQYFIYISKQEFDIFRDKVGRRIALVAKRNKNPNAGYGYYYDLLEHILIEDE